MSPPPYQVRGIAAVLALLLVASCSDDAGPGAEKSRPVRVGPAGELVTLVEKGRGVAHHAVYEQSGGDRFEVWVDGDRAREELIPAGGGDRRLVLRTDGKVLECVGSGSEWSCEEPASGTGDDVQTEVDRLVADLGTADVAARDATIAGRDVRCFAVTSPEEPVEICVTVEGVLARLALADQRLELVSIESEIDPDVFDPPAG